MKTSRLTPWLFAALVCLARADSDPDITGTYYDKGTQIVSGGSEPTIVSLHGLMSLEFSPHVHEADFSAASRITFVKEDNTLDFEIKGEEDNIIWADNWGARDGYSTSDEGAVIRMRSPRHPDSRVVFIMSTLDDGNVLKVRAYDVDAAIFGPRAEPIAIYVFVKAD